MVAIGSLFVVTVLYIVVERFAPELAVEVTSSFAITLATPDERLNFMSKTQSEEVTP